MINLPDLQEMLASGVHFGHQMSKKHPKMDPYIHTSRNRIAIINLEQTAQKLHEAAVFIEKLALAGGTILFVASKRQARSIIKAQAEACGMPYINSRWLGGTFTNFSNIIKLTRKLKELEQKQKSGELEKYTKKERVDFQKEITRLSDLVGGIKEMLKLPDAIFAVDVKKDETAVKEANKKNIPVVAMTDTNTNPEKIKYPIPANDDAIKSIELICGVISKVIKEAKEKKQ